MKFTYVVNYTYHMFWEEDRWHSDTFQTFDRADAEAFIEELKNNEDRIVDDLTLVTYEKLI